MPFAFADVICESLAAPVDAALVDRAEVAPALEAADELEGAALLVDAGVLLLGAVALAEEFVGVDGALSLTVDDFLLFLLVPVSLDAVVDGAFVDSDAVASGFRLFLLLLVVLVASEAFADALP